MTNVYLVAAGHTARWIGSAAAVFMGIWAYAALLRYWGLNPGQMETAVMLTFLAIVVGLVFKWKLDDARYQAEKQLTNR
jgi:uncharacterized membrane protein